MDGIFLDSCFILCRILGATPQIDLIIIDRHSKPTTWWYISILEADTFLSEPKVHGACKHQNRQMLRMLSWHGNIGSIMHCVLHVMAVYWHVVVWWQCVPCYSLPIMCPRAACSAPPRPAPASTPPGPQCRDLRQCGSNLAASTHQHTVHCSSEHTLHLSTV